MLPEIPKFSIQDIFAKFTPSPMSVQPPPLREIDFAPKNVRLPAIISTRNPWTYDGQVTTAPHYSEFLPDIKSADLRPELPRDTVKNYVYEIVDVRKPDFHVSLPEEHKAIGIHIKQASLFPVIDCHFQ
jgi:hypothetical protein